MNVGNVQETTTQLQSNFHRVSRLEDFSEGILVASLLNSNEHDKKCVGMMFCHPIKFGRKSKPFSALMACQPGGRTTGGRPKRVCFNFIAHQTIVVSM